MSISNSIFNPNPVTLKKLVILLPGAFFGTFIINQFTWSLFWQFWYLIMHWFKFKKLAILFPGAFFGTFKKMEFFTKIHSLHRNKPIRLIVAIKHYCLSLSSKFYSRFYIDSIRRLNIGQDKGIAIAWRLLHVHPPNFLWILLYQLETLWRRRKIILFILIILGVPIERPLK